MNQAFLDRPELICGPNPFIEEADPYIPFHKLAEKLGRDALKDIPWQSIPPAYREPLLNRKDLHFCPHREILGPSSDIQNLYRAGLDRRNPWREGEIARTNQIAIASSRQELLRCGDGGGGGGILAAMTAMGKSALFRRIAELICTRPSIDMGSSKALGWDRLIHVPLLFVDCASNGSHGGVLFRVLLALDQLLGTSYSDDLKRTRNLDILLVQVCKRLSNIRCALLVIDENQQSNFEESPWRIEFILFYLSLMNLGINVLLIGNPLAFSHLVLSSQVMRRFSVAGHHKMAPAANVSELWWSKDYMPRVRKFDLVENWDVSLATREDLEFGYCGGITGLGASFNVEVQRIALRNCSDKPEATVKEDDFHAAAKAPTFVEQRRIALAVQGGSSAENAPFTDVDMCASNGANSGREQGDKSPSLKTPNDSTISFVQRSALQRMLGHPVCVQH